MIDIMKWRWWYLGFSAIALSFGLIGLVLFKLKPSIDFTGGSLLEVKLVNEVTTDRAEWQKTVGEMMELSAVQSSGDKQLILRGKAITDSDKNQVVSQIQKQYGDVAVLRFEAVGPTLGRELFMKTLAAIGLVISFITFYLWYRFKDIKFGIFAILAMLHDSLILLTSFSWLGHWWGVEIDVLFVTAMLTTLSFSVHDTIVMYDRIRELRRHHRAFDVKTLVNTAVVETFGRSLNNSLTIILMLLSLVVLGGETLKWFAVALLVGAVTGTYSSTFVAAPLLVVWEELRLRQKKTT